MPTPRRAAAIVTVNPAMTSTSCITVSKQKIAFSAGQLSVMVFQRLKATAEAVNIANELFSSVETLDRRAFGDFERNFLCRKVTARKFSPQETQHVGIAHGGRRKIDRNSADGPR